MTAHTRRGGEGSAVPALALNATDATVQENTPHVGGVTSWPQQAVAMQPAVCTARQNAQGHPVPVGRHRRPQMRVGQQKRGRHQNLALLWPSCKCATPRKSYCEKWSRGWCEAQRSLLLCAAFCWCAANSQLLWLLLLQASPSRNSASYSPQQTLLGATSRGQSVCLAQGSGPSSSRNQQTLRRVLGPPVGPHAGLAWALGLLCTPLPAQPHCCPGWLT